MSAFWQAKIWGLLHDPALKALHDNTGRGSNSFWQELEVMQDWLDNGLCLANTMSTFILLTLPSKCKVAHEFT